VNPSPEGAPTLAALGKKSATALGLHPSHFGAQFPSQSSALSDEYQRIGGARNPCSGLGWGSLEADLSLMDVSGRQGHKGACHAICTNPTAGAPTTSGGHTLASLPKTCSRSRPCRRSHEPTDERLQPPQRHCLSPQHIQPASPSSLTTLLRLPGVAKTQRSSQRSPSVSRPPTAFLRLIPHPSAVGQCSIWLDEPQLPQHRRLGQQCDENPCASLSNHHSHPTPSHIQILRAAQKGGKSLNATSTRNAVLHFLIQQNPSLP
jgi:hypothetical protein